MKDKQPVYPCTGWGTAHVHTVGVLKLDYVTSPDALDQHPIPAQSLHVALDATKLRSLAQDLRALADVLDNNRAKPQH